MNRWHVICSALVLVIIIQSILILDLNQDYISVSSEISALTSLYSDLSLELEYVNLQNQYRNLSEDHTDLQNNYESLSSEYSNLQSDHTNLEISYGNLVENYGKWRAYLRTDVHFSESVSRTLCDNEVQSLVSLVNSIVSNPNNWWGSIKQLYDCEVNNIDYAYDEPFPIPPTIVHFETGNYRNETTDQIYLSPSETLQLGQGDCDDQAVLLYGLVKAYNKHVYGMDYELWVMRITLENVAHLSVVFPVSGG